MFTINAQEALNVLDSAVAQLQANRSIHSKLQQAVLVLKQVVESKELSEKEKKK